MSYAIGWANNPPDEDEEWMMMADIAMEAKEAKDCEYGSEE